MKEQSALSALLLAGVCAVGVAQEPPKLLTVKDFKARERSIVAKTQEEYSSAREGLAKEAITLAEKSIKTPQAEELLHWVVRGGANSDAAQNATELLIQHHTTSRASVRNLLSYAIAPTGCTPRHFAGFAKASVPEDLRWIVSATTAIHRKSLLLIADEMAVDESAAALH